MASAAGIGLGVFRGALGLFDRRTRLKIDLWRTFVLVPDIEEGIPEWWGVTVANVGTAPVQIVGWEVSFGTRSLGHPSHVGRPPSVGDLVATVGGLGQGELVAVPVTIPPHEQRHFGSISHVALVDAVRPFVERGVDRVPCAVIRTGTGKIVRGPEMPPHRPVIRSRLTRWWRRVGPGSLPYGRYSIPPQRLKVIQLERLDEAGHTAT